MSGTPVVCTRCNAWQQGKRRHIKFGWYLGRKRYKCWRCGCHFTRLVENPRSGPYAISAARYKRLEIVELKKKGISLRASARILKVPLSGIRRVLDEEKERGND